nr:hypothetical protein [Tanacetum cinerariifolium]
MVLCSILKSPSYSPPHTNLSKLLMILLVLSLLSIAWIMVAALSLSLFLQIDCGKYCIRIPFRRSSRAVRTSMNPRGLDCTKNTASIPNNRGRRVIPFDHFINNDLEYLRGGASSRRYTTSVTKTKAADYGHIMWIEDLVPRTMWIGEPIGYDKHALWGRHVEDLQLGVESYQKKLNLTKPDTYQSDLKRKEAYS